jgi:hypothetical protein
MLDWRSSPGVVAHGLGTHHGLDLLHAHHLPRRRRLLRSRSRLGRRLPLGHWLLGLEAPDVRTRLQLRDVLGVLVALIAASVGLRRLRDRWSLILLLLVLMLVLGDPLASLIDHLLFLQRVRDHGGLPGEVEVLTNGLFATEGIVVEVIRFIVKLVA